MRTANLNVGTNNISENYLSALAEALKEIGREVDSAKGVHVTVFNSFHEGYAVIKEEIDELWTEVKKREHDNAAIRKEAVQAAAMLVRLIVERTTPV
jgi:hypothetical protein